MDSVRSMLRLRMFAIYALCILVTSCATGEDQDANSDEIALLEQQIAQLESEVAKLTSTTSSVSPSTSVSVTTSTSEVTSSTTKSNPVAPQGGLIFNDCDKCGQSFPTGACANWRLSVTNSSDEKVKSFVFKPPSSFWREIAAGFSGVEVKANSPSRTITINLAPYDSTEIQFQICTDTPPPGSGWEYSNYAPQNIPFTWASGAKGNACFNIGCF